jgi:hypothetical protein
MHLPASDLKRRFAELRDLVNEWDPIRLIEAGCPLDEYDCMVGPLLRRLEGHEALSSIAAYLEVEFRDHFGAPASGVEEFASRASAWYRTRWPGTDDIPSGDTL